MKKLKVLLAEDDPNLGMLIREFLNAKEFETELCENGAIALNRYKNDEFDFIITDVMMPQMDGFRFAQEIRKIDKEIPIIFLTVKSMKEDVVKGLKLGADDYIRKPFHMEELLLRINAIKRRTIDKIEDQDISIFQIGSYTFDPEKQILSFDGTHQKLSSKESDVLTILCKNMNKVVERSYILVKVWNNDDYFSGRSMDVYITKLRKYLKNDPNLEIMNIHGKGYKLMVG